MESAPKPRGTDRRRKPRGGRRADDVKGLTPLVVVVDPDPARRELSLGILARLGFAVAPVGSLAEAMAVLPSLTPEVIVASRTEASRLVAALSAGSAIPIVTADDEAGLTDSLVESVRSAIRRERMLG